MPASRRRVLVVPTNLPIAIDVSLMLMMPRMQRPKAAEPPTPPASINVQADFNGNLLAALHHAGSLPPSQRKIVHLGTAVYTLNTGISIPPNTTMQGTRTKDSQITFAVTGGGKPSSAVCGVPAAVDFYFGGCSVGGRARARSVGNGGGVSGIRAANIGGRSDAVGAGTGAGADRPQHCWKDIAQFSNTSASLNDCCTKCKANVAGVTTNSLSPVCRPECARGH